MISGYATPAGIAEWKRGCANQAFNPLGDTGLTVSAAGFGGYRIGEGVPAHATALEKALLGGVNLVDTSANYTDGGSERLIGQVLGRLIAADRIRRQHVVVVSKGGYIQGANDAVRQQREADGRPFEDVVDVADGLAHCIHPDFLDDQISRSLERLNLETIDGYLLHNPEYYLGWAHKAGLDPEAARQEYDRRIEAAFRHLETEVAGGRIRFYGISSNTLPAAAADPEFTSLHRVWEIAGALSDHPHFKIIQLPFNLFEAGAVLEKNQPGDQTVLEFARDHRLGVLVNRPLNAFTRKRMVRLADVPVPSRMDYKDIIHRIKQLAQSETRLWRKILPAMDVIPGGIKVRIKQQACFAEALKHHWRSFGGYERWREAKDGIFLPRIQGVINFLRPLSADNPDLDAWIAHHERAIDRALAAVGSIYADDAVAQGKKILGAVGRADEDWDRPGTLSRKAIRALISTAGVTSVLVGMRQDDYVSEVLTELRHPVQPADRVHSWKRLKHGLSDNFGE